MSNRQIEGQNNKQGNRYEDFFATYQLLKFMSCPIRHSWQNNTGRWRTVESILLQITGLEFWVDKGHFEWRYSTFVTQGIVREPCANASFSRFMDRVINHPPTTFEDFERLLP